MAAECAADWGSHLSSLWALLCSDCSNHDYGNGVFCIDCGYSPNHQVGVSSLRVLEGGCDVAGAHSHCSSTLHPASRSWETA